MGFKKKTWSDRKTEYPNRRLLTKEDGSTELVTVSREEGIISSEGDAFSAENMNNLEERINTAVAEVNAKFENYLLKSGGTLTGKVEFEGNTSVRPDANAAYSAPLVFHANYSEDHTKRAGVGFHNQGLNAAFLYLADDSCFHCMDAIGTDRRMVTNDELAYLRTTTIMTEVEFSNGVATIVKDLSAHGRGFWGALVCGVGTQNTFACSNIDATISNASLQIQCVNNPSYSGTQLLNILYYIS